MYILSTLIYSDFQIDISKLSCRFAEYTVTRFFEVLRAL